MRACDDDDENKCEVPIGTEKRREEKKILFPSEIENLRCSEKKRQFDICAFSYETLIIFFSPRCCFADQKESESGAFLESARGKFKINLVESAAALNVVQLERSGEKYE